MANTRKPTLVTDSHRAGGMWAGKIFTAAPPNEYIHEPSYIHISKTKVSPVKGGQYICTDNRHQYQEFLCVLIHSVYSSDQNLAKARPSKSFTKIQKLKRPFLFGYLNHYSQIVKDQIRQFQHICDSLCSNHLALKTNKSMAKEF